MPASEAVKKAVAKYQAKQERLTIHVPMGKKEEYKEKAKSKGLSLNSYVIKLIENDN